MGSQFKVARSWGFRIGGMLLMILGLAGLASGASLLERVKDQEIVQTLRLRVGRSKVLRSPFRITRISVADPTVADIVLISEQEVYVNGLAPGVTNLGLWGRSRSQFTAVTVAVEADITLLKEKLAQILPNEKIAVQAAGDSVVLSGEVSSPVSQSTAINLAAAFAAGKGKEAGPGPAVEGAQKGEGKQGKVVNLLHIGGVQQVMVAVRVAELNRTLGKRMGINFAGISGSGNFGISMLDALAPFGLTTLLNNVLLTDVTEGWRLPQYTALTGPGISSAVNAMGGFRAGGIIWTLFFSVLKEKGLGRILAEPNLVTTSGQQASFLAGGEVPIPKPGALGTVGIDYKQYGVALGFTPTVLDDGKIAMRVEPEVSEIDPTYEPLVVAGLLVPAFRTRRTSTHVEVKDGQTFAIAGLLSDQSRTIQSKFPILGNIPILGTLFRSSEFQKRETELVILVTPSLVKPMSTEKVRLPTDSYVEPDDLEFYLLGDMEGRKPKPKPGPALKQALPQGFGHQPVE